MLHGADADIDGLAERAVRFVTDRIETIGRSPLGRTIPPSDLMPLFDGAIARGGLGADRAWSLFETAVAPNTVALDGPRYLAFIPMSPCSAAIWMDAVVGASSPPGNAGATRIGPPGDGHRVELTVQPVDDLRLDALAANSHPQGAVTARLRAEDAKLGEAIRLLETHAGQFGMLWHLVGQFVQVFEIVG